MKLHNASVSDMIGAFFMLGKMFIEFPGFSFAHF